MDEGKLVYVIDVELVQVMCPIWTDNFQEILIFFSL